MSDQRSFASPDHFHPDPYTTSQTAERILNAAILNAEVSRSFEEYLEIFDEFYADDMLNTAIDSDDGNPQLRAKARQALGSWLDRLQSIAEEGQRRGEVRSDVDSEKLATLIASTLEGSHMVSRLQRKEVPLDLACRHLEEYLETEVRVRKSKARADKS